MSKFIIATKTITYDVEAIREGWAENNGGVPPTDEEIGEIVTEWVREDMRLTSDEFDLRWTDTNPPGCVGSHITKPSRSSVKAVYIRGAKSQTGITE